MYSSTSAGDHILESKTKRILSHPYGAIMSTSVEMSAQCAVLTTAVIQIVAAVAAVAAVAVAIRLEKARETRENIRFIYFN